ncbi:MAG: hypothetical protein BGP05_18950 [Rhizobiales bacterium 62-47]|nr:hypothetical protein [Hyphomicrobiales bacterium]OJY10569.1 MAG: hypothetical protein BGP05_18950 [Rhizobiales bacterium 62-47]
MKARLPAQASGTAQVVKFSPRTSSTRPGHASFGPPGFDLHDEPGMGEPDDFRHRMLANAAAFAFTVALTAIGIWLATSIADLQKSQDCALMGRSNCAPIAAPHS